MNTRQTLLIASHSARYSVRGGIGLVFLLLSLTFGLLVAHLMLQPVEIAGRQIQEHSKNQDEQAARERALKLLTDQAKPVVAWMLESGSGESGSGEAESAASGRRPSESTPSEVWADYLLKDRPGALSAIFLVLLFGWPLIVAFGAFNLYSSDIGTRQLRYQLLRTDRGSIYVGRLLGMVLTFLLVLLLVGATVTLYMGLKLRVYPWSDLLQWQAYGTVALAVVSLPYIALCAWVSACTGSAFASLTIASVVIGGVPLFAVYGGMQLDAARYLNYLLPWGFQTRLFHPEAAQVALAVGGCALLTMVYAGLGYRKFTTRDL